MTNPLQNTRTPLVVWFVVEVVEVVRAVVPPAVVGFSAVAVGFLAVVVALHVVRLLEVGTHVVVVTVGGGVGARVQVNGGGTAAVDGLQRQAEGQENIVPAQSAGDPTTTRGAPASARFARQLIPDTNLLPALGATGPLQRLCDAPRLNPSNNACVCPLWYV